MKIKLLGNKTVYEDIADQYVRYIELGVLKSGEKLPSCRQLAMELGVNPNTVSHAYSILEEKGYATSFEKRGVYVNEISTSNLKLKEKAKEEVYKLYLSGISLADLNEVVLEVYKENKND